MKKAEDTSNLDSDEELQKRKKKKNSFYFPEDLSSSGFSKFHKPLKNCVQNRNTDIIYPTPPEVQRIELEIESGKTNNSQKGNLAIDYIDCTKFYTYGKGLLFICYAMY